MLSYEDVSEKHAWPLVAAGRFGRPPLQADPKILAAIPRMRPYESKEIAPGQWALGRNPGRNYLVYSANAGVLIQIDLTNAAGTFSVYWVDGEGLKADGDISAGAIKTFQSPPNSVLWLTRK